MGLFSLAPRQGVIISGFAGIGKTGLKEHCPYFEDKKIYDLSSSYFRKNPGWEKVYCDLALNLIKEYDYVFVSTHDGVINEFLSRQIKFYIVYPKQYCKDEYIQRFLKRGNSQEYVSKFVKNWDYYINMLDNVKSDYKINLRSGQYLSDVINRIR